MKTPHHSLVHSLNSSKYIISSFCEFKLSGGGGGDDNSLQFLDSEEISQIEA
jgi:hypothetical protein